MDEIVFQITQEADGGYTAECLTENIFTEGETWADLQKNVMDAIAGFYFDREKPQRVRLHLVKDEILAVG
jgi:predicted RNase H-like HicB family nuclease